MTTLDPPESLLLPGPYSSTQLRDLVTTTRPSGREGAAQRVVRLPLFLTVPAAPETPQCDTPAGPFPVCLLLNGFQGAKYGKRNQCAREVAE
jgi:hypothetical protein